MLVVNWHSIVTDAMLVRLGGVGGGGTTSSKAGPWWVVVRPLSPNKEHMTARPVHENRSIVSSWGLSRENQLQPKKIEAKHLLRAF